MSDILTILELHGDSCFALSGDDFPVDIAKTKAWQLEAYVAMHKSHRAMEQAAAEITTLRTRISDLERERDEARDKALEEAAMVAANHRGTQIEVLGRLKWRTAGPHAIAAAIRSLQDKGERP